MNSRPLQRDLSKGRKPGNRDIRFLSKKSRKEIFVEESPKEDRGRVPKEGGPRLSPQPELPSDRFRFALNPDCTCLCLNAGAS